MELKASDLDGIPTPNLMTKQLPRFMLRDLGRELTEFKYVENGLCGFKIISKKH